MENQLVPEVPAWANVPRLLHAISKFRAKCPVIDKDREVKKTYNEKTQKWFGGWGYASLPAIYTIIQPLLVECKLDYLFQPATNGNTVTVTMILFWSDGKECEVMTASLSWNAGGDIKDLGGVISYLSRYLLRSMLGLAVDDESDDDGASFKEPKQETRKGPSVAMAKPTQEVPGVDYHLSHEDEINFKNAQTWPDYMAVWGDLVEGQRQQTHIIQMFVEKAKTRDEMTEIWRALPADTVASKPVAEIFKAKGEKLAKKGAGK